MMTLPTLPGINRDVFVGVGSNLWTGSPADPSILQKSTNGGISWTSVYDFADVLKIVIEFSDGTLLVSTDPNDSFTDPTAKWWQSTDGGLTFTNTLTYSTGGVQPWSFAYSGNTVLVGEYGKYNSPTVHKSTDKGATWSTCFTHPRQALSATMHIHKLYINPANSSQMWMSVGDGSPARGIWYSTDSGSNWTEFDKYYQPTWLEIKGDKLIVYSDGDGMIFRTSVSQVLAATQVLQPVYYAPDDTAGDFGTVSFYCGAVTSNGLIFAGGVAYGVNSGNTNDKDAMLLVSVDDGASWKVVKTYARNATSSSGPSYISKESPSGLLYVKNNNPEQVEIINIYDPEFYNLPQTYFPNKSRITLRGTIRTN